MNLKNVIDKATKFFFGDFEKTALTAIIVLLVGWFEPRIAVVLLVLWLLLLERRLRR